MTVPQATKYAIIGAGIHGLSTAFHLAQHRGQNIAELRRGLKIVGLQVGECALVSVARG
ncbi:MAG TPA: FAD-dependent oxidoreductase [Methyloceanibacter sp.]|jgi:glycine/D-amino acid oxidase-like deaminating enzyme|nr:FAD-dependent oxidoreductase [Methyloceanibacter sp.]